MLSAPGNVAPAAEVFRIRSVPGSKAILRNSGPNLPDLFLCATIHGKGV
jgi:hypothetical protein